MAEVVLSPALHGNLRPTAAVAVAPYPVLHRNLLPMEKAVVGPSRRHLRPKAVGRYPMVVAPAVVVHHPENRLCLCL